MGLSEGPGQKGHTPWALRQEVDLWVPGGAEKWVGQCKVLE